MQLLGNGNFAKVYEAKHCATRASFAVKVLDKDRVQNRLDDMVQEFKVLRKVRHPNIIRLYGAYETRQHLYLVTELAAGGPLLKRRKPIAESVLSEDVVTRHTYAMLDAVRYMHSMHCVHRDLKPDNVLLSDTTEDATIKIVDMGLSKYHEDGNAPLRTLCGTHEYLAPEVVQVGLGKAKGYGKAIDVWAVGLMTYMMLFGPNPFARKSGRSRNVAETHAAIVKCKWAFPDGNSLSERGKDFIGRLLWPVPEGRSTAEEAMRHSWLAQAAAASADVEARYSSSSAASSVGQGAAVTGVRSGGACSPLARNSVRSSAGEYTDSGDDTFEGSSKPPSSKLSMSAKPATELEGVARSPEARTAMELAGHMRQMRARDPLPLKLGPLVIPTRSPLLSMARIEDLRVDMMSDDIAIEPGMREWSEEEVIAYFESGGVQVPSE
jgi:serine/threonine protein kinase